MKTFPAIYDFGILPYALGDVLTWTVKCNIRRLEVSYDKTDILICLDKSTPSNKFQSAYITEENYWSHFLELQPAFLTTDSINQIRIFNNRKDLTDYLKTLYSSFNEVEPIAYIKEYFNVIESIDSHFEVENYVIRNVTTHKDINEYYKKAKSFPCLNIPSSIKAEVENFIKRFGPNCIPISINMRLRKHDTSSDLAVLSRDSDLATWIDFFKEVENEHPQVKFFLLGKIQEKPVELQHLENVIIPRLYGMNLGHDLALIQETVLFIGASSGFAAMANFSETPYAITKMSASAYHNYQIENNCDRLPFASTNQTLIPGDESKEILLSIIAPFFKLFQKDKSPSLSIPIKTFKIPNTPFPEPSPSDINLKQVSDLIKKGHHALAERSLSLNLLKSLKSTTDKNEFYLSKAQCSYSRKQYASAKSEILLAINFSPNCKTTNNLKTKINCALLLNNIERFQIHNPDIKENFLNIEKIKACALNIIGEFSEATKAIKIHLKENPNDNSSKELLEKIKQTQ